MSVHLTELVVSLTGFHPHPSSSQTYCDVYENPDHTGWNIFVHDSRVHLLYRGATASGNLTYLTERKRPPYPEHILQALKRVQDALLVLA